MAGCHQARMTSSVLAAFLLSLVVSTMAAELPYFCGFEDSGLCGMDQKEDDDFNWTRHTGSTPSADTGPDGAADGLWYMYIETSYFSPDNREQGDRAYIQTPAIEYTGDVCIRFQYHMYGYHIGKLVVFVDARGENSTAAFNKSGYQDTTWHRANVNVEGFMTGERVVFMAERGNGYFGDIAIDDLHIANGTCHECQVNNGGCDHRCLPQGRWAICFCDDGYIKDGRRCIPVSPTRTPSTTIAILSNTTSTVRRNTASSQSPLTTTTRVTEQQMPSTTTARVPGQQTPSTTTASVTGQQTEKTSGLEDQLNYCIEACSKVVDADQAFESGCETEELLFNEPRDQCLREACHRGLDVVAVRNDVCDLKLCHDGDIQLAASAGSFGWDIFVLNRTWSGSICDRHGHSDFPMWQVIVAVIVVVLAVIALAVGVAVYLKRRKMASQVKDPTRAYYENDAALTARPAGDVTKPANEAPYEDVECPRPVTASAVQIQMSPPRSDPEDPNLGGYEDLEPYEPRVAGPYDVIM